MAAVHGSSLPVACGLLLALGAAPVARAGIAFVGLQALGVAPAERANLERLVTRVLEDVAGANLMTPQQVRDLLTDPELDRLAQCIGKTACQVDLGGLTGSQLVLSGSVARFGEGSLLVLKLVDVLADAEQDVVQQRVGGNDAALLDALRRLVLKLVQPERYSGRIQVLVPLDGASIAIDGQPVGTSPLAEPVARLFAGTHTVTVDAPGHRRFTAMVEVDVDTTTTVTATLTPLGVTAVGGGPVAAAPVVLPGGPGTVGLIGSISLSVVAVALGTVAAIGGVAVPPAGQEADTRYAELAAAWTLGQRLDSGPYTQAVRERDGGYRLALLGGGLGGACLLGAALWLWLSWEEERIMPAVALDGAGGSVVVRGVWP